MIPFVGIRRALALAVAAVVFTAAPVGAQEQPPVRAQEPAPVTAATGIPVFQADEVGRREVLGRLVVAKSAVTVAKRAEAGATARARATALQATAEDARVAAAGAADGEAAVALEAARLQMRRRAVAAYVLGPTAKLEFALNAKGIDDVSSRRVFLDSVERRDRRAVALHRNAVAAASGELLAATRARDAATGAAAVARAEAAAATETRVAAEAALSETKLLLDLVTAAGPAPDTDIPRLALDAYRRAADLVRAVDPGCRLRWQVLAAIGRVESNHGRIHAGRLGLNGDVAPRIIGIPLDGSNSTQAISDSDGGLLDGDVVVDRAVGPMQFIPTTWAWAGRDGNGDGLHDPNNIYDAALAAAGYLCRAGGAALDTDAPLRQAVFAYNHSPAYVEKVVGLTVGYDQVVLTPAASLQPPPTGRAARPARKR